MKPLSRILDPPLHPDVYLENSLVWMTQTVALLPYDSPLFRKNKSALSYYGKIKVFGKYCILMPGLHSVGGGGIFVIKFYSTEIKVSSGTHLNTRKYIVYSIKLLTSPPPPPSVKLFFLFPICWIAKTVRYVSNAKKTLVRIIRELKLLSFSWKKYHFLWKFSLTIFMGNLSLRLSEVL